MITLVTKVKKTIEKFKLLSPRQRVLVGVSGGPDSIALLEILYNLRKVWNIDLIVVHYDHRLRKESSSEALFVKKEAKKRNLPFILGTCPVRIYARREKLSLETAARELRYRFFEKIAQKKDADKVALAHQADDLAEEVLLRFIRGAGRRGLAGIPVKRGGLFIRPLLLTSRQEIEHFLKEQKLAYVEDPSNQDPRFLRNRVRHLLIPFLEKHFHRGVKQCLKRTALIVAEEEEFLGEIAAQALKKYSAFLGNTFSLQVKGLKDMPLALRRRVFLEALKKAGVPLLRIRLAHIEQIESLLEGRARGPVNLPKGFIARREPGRIIIKPFAPPPVPYSLEIYGPGLYKLPFGGLIEVKIVSDFDIHEGSILIDLQKISWPLIIRSPLPGDRIKPPGFSGHRKLKKLFWERKLSPEERIIWPVIVYKNKIIGLLGFFTDSEFLPSKKDKALMIQLKTPSYPSKGGN